MGNDLSHYVTIWVIRYKRRFEVESQDHFENAGQLFTFVGPIKH
jgi:hypothetical protein